MSWKTELVESLRYLISDWDEPFTYTSERLKTMICVAAKYVQQDADFDITYNISVNKQEIIPDPVSDSAFSNLTVLRSACIIDVNDLRFRAKIGGVKIKLGPAILESSVNKIPGMAELLKSGPCEAYQATLRNWQIGNPIAKAVLSPFVNSSWSPPLGDGGDSTRSSRV